MRALWWWVLGFLAAAVVAAVVGVLAWHDLNVARRDLIEAKAKLAATANIETSLVSDQGLGGAQRNIDAALVDIDRAHRTVSRSPGLFFARFLPVVSAQRSGVFDLVDDSKTGATAAKTLLRRVQALAKQNRVEGGAVSLDALNQLDAAVSRAGNRIKPLVRSSAELFGSLRTARNDFNVIAADVSRRLLDGADAIRAGRSILGANGERHFLVAMENNAEMRDQGAILSYAVARLGGGRLTFEKTGRIGELTLHAPVAMSIPAGTAKVFGGIAPTQLWQSV